MIWMLQCIEKDFDKRRNFGIINIRQKNNKYNSNYLCQGRR